MKDQQRLFILSLLGYASQRDISAEAVCQSLGINLGSINGDTTISSKQFEGLWMTLVQWSNDPLFGLHFGESLQLQALGVVGDLVKSSTTVGEAIQTAASFTQFLTDLFTMEISATRKTFSVLLQGAQPLNEVMKQMADALMVFAVHELDGLTLKKIKPMSVTFPYSIGNRAEYSRVFRCETIKKGNRWEMQFDIGFWKEELITADHELKNLLLEKVSRSLKKRSVAFKDRVQQFMMTNSFLGVTSLHDVAANFNMSERTLQRKLSEDGITFQVLSERVKKELALYYLQAGNHPIKAVSAMLGYNELSAFTRAFKRWTGKAPREILS